MLRVRKDFVSRLKKRNGWFPSIICCESIEKNSNFT